MLKPIRGSSEKVNLIVDVPQVIKKILFSFTKFFLPGFQPNVRTVVDKKLRLSLTCFIKLNGSVFCFGHTGRNNNLTVHFVY